mgnify:CR=1 FL=1
MLGLSLNGQASGSSAVVIEDYLWSCVAAGEITPRFSDVRLGNVQDFNDAWDIGTANEMMPAVVWPQPNYISDDEGYWVVTEASNAVMGDGEDMTAGQDGDTDTELTPIAVGNFPIGGGNYVA